MSIAEIFIARAVKIHVPLKNLLRTH